MDLSKNHDQDQSPQTSGPSEGRDQNNRRKNGYQTPVAPRGKPSRDSLPEYDYGKLFSVADGRSDDFPSHRSSHRDRDLSRFEDRLSAGKAKLCASCGGVMAKSSRMILSVSAGLLLIVLGALLMALYGVASNFYQTPWYLKFALPAAYYIGSLFVGIGILFFFIRERVWICKKCKESTRR